jgi:hypothetical protein
MDLLLESEHPSDLIALYMFYYYTAKWQKTNQIKATESYVRVALKWGEDRFRRSKKLLVELGLIKNIKIKDSNSSKIIGHYIQLNLIPIALVSTRLENPPRNASESITPKGVNISSEEVKKESPAYTRTREGLGFGTQKIQNRNLEEEFERLSKIWPKGRKGSIGAARTKWNSKKSKIPPIRNVLKKVKQLKKTDHWRNGFVPHMSTWINQECWNDDPSELNYDNKKSEKDLSNITNHPLMVNGFMNRFGELNNKAIFRLDKALTEFENYYKSLPKGSPSEHSRGVRYYIPSSRALFLEYLDWIVVQTWIINPSPELFCPDNGAFKQFIQYMENSIGLCFKTGGSLF